MEESIFWTGDNLEEIIAFCGEDNTIYNVDDQTLYVRTPEGLRAVAYDNAIKSDEHGKLIVD